MCAIIYHFFLICQGNVPFVYYLSELDDYPSIYLQHLLSLNSHVSVRLKITGQNVQFHCPRYDTASK
jgi:hypothetical protein